MTDLVTLTFEEALRLARDACLGAGADAASAEALARATIAAHRQGRPEVGFAHLPDYLKAYREGRINRKPQPRLSQPFAAFLESDADGGIAQLGFDHAFGALVSSTRQCGIALFSQRRSYTSGELGYYVRRLAEEGLIALAFTNANAFMAPAPGLPRLYSTNPLAFAFPLGRDERPLLIDQSSAATAFVNVVAAAERGESLAEGIAVDADGQPTTDPRLAILGALLPFGGRKGANLALLVELMAAGLTGARWSECMPDFRSGDTWLDVGLTVIAFVPGSDPEETVRRAHAFADRLKTMGLHVPGRSERETGGSIRLAPSLHATVRSYAASSIG